MNNGNTGVNEFGFSELRVSGGLQMKGLPLLSVL